MRILCTGHRGFIGSYLMKQLPKDTIGLDIKEGNDILECDLPDADVVIHLAAQPGVIASVEDPFTNARTNILGTIRLLQRYQDATFVFASSGGTIQESIESPYGLSKKTCEEYIKLLHDDYIILRFPNVYGTGSRSVVDKWLKEPEMVIYGDGHTNRIYAYVEDVVEAITESLAWPTNQTYKLGTNQRYSVNELAQAVINRYPSKTLRYAPERPGEITHTNSQLPNETPDWKAKVEVMDYINGFSSNS